MEKERKVITIRVPPELKFQIDKAANIDGYTLNSWIIKAIEEKLNKHEKKEGTEINLYPKFNLNNL